MTFPISFLNPPSRSVYISGRMNLTLTKKTQPFDTFHPDVQENKFCMIYQVTSCDYHAETIICRGRDSKDKGPFTSHKQSLGQGNVFTHVCHSVHNFPACITGPMTRRLCIQGWVCMQGVCTQRESASRGSLHPRVGLHPGDSAWGEGWDTTGYGQQAGGTHPTCYILVTDVSVLDFSGKYITFLMQVYQFSVEGMTVL